MRDHYNSNPVLEIRKCLKCDREFKSEGDHNRLCDCCHDTNKLIEDRYLWFFIGSGRRARPAGVVHPVHVILPGGIDTDGL